MGSRRIGISTYRLAADIVFLLSVLLLPFWVAIVLGLVLLFYFRNYWEVIPILFISDLLYAIPEHRFAGVMIISTLGAVVVYFLMQALKKRLIVINE